MKTWEMIKELTENPSKEFTRKSDGLHIKTNKYGELIWDSGYQFLRLHHDWEEIKKPVDFMTAFQAFRKMKTISVKCDGMEDAVFLGKSNGHAIFHEEYIENGKWYIENCEVKND